GYSVVFQRNALVLTEVPVKYQQLCKMFLRWARSNVRETTVMARFIFRRFRAGARFGARVNFAFSVAALGIYALLWAPLMVWMVTHPLSAATAIAAGAVVAATVPAAIYELSRRDGC